MPILLSFAFLLCTTIAIAQDAPERRWWNDMDYGPFLSSSVGLGKAREHAAAKGITIRLGAQRQMSVTFDTDLLRMAFGWEGFLRLNGVSYDGGHGSFPWAEGNELFHTRATAGVGPTPDLEDKRPSAAGPIPKDIGRYTGLYRNGSKVTLAYSIDGHGVLEQPDCIDLAGRAVLVRDFFFEPCASNRVILLADAVGFVQDDGARSATDGATQQCVALGGEGTCKLQVHKQADATRVLLFVPASRQPLRIRVGHARGDGAAAALRDLPGPADPRDNTHGGPALWAQELVQPCEMGKGDGAWVVDTVGIPFENPWHCEMRLGGFELFPNSERGAVCTWNGDVWLVSGLVPQLTEARWKRFAAGMFETLGLVIADGKVLVSGRDQITRLHDLNDDGEADYYENFNNDVQATTNFHEFVFDLQRDSEGNFWMAKAAPVRPGGRGFDRIVPHHGTLMKVSPDGAQLTVHATGLRAPNGIGVGPQGQITTGDNQGTWVPRCKLNWTRPGSFQGVIDSAHSAIAPTDYEKPLCWFPMEVDNSSGAQVWTRDARFGLPAETLLHLSYGQSSVYRVLQESVDGQVQGGVTRIPMRLDSSAMRARFDPRDGQMWITGLRGWQTNAAKLAGLQRVRRTQTPLRMASGLRALSDGMELSFDCELAPELANDPESYSVEIWDYVWSPQYGGPEVSVFEPDDAIVQKAKREDMHDFKAHDTLQVTAAKLQADGRTVKLTFKRMVPAMQMHITCDLADKAGKDFKSEIWNTVHKLGSAKQQ
ncbi:MAG: hypothetical protein EXS14_09070 [Planctomycetes bacterium]|nr:hypothetical protein [Planctomycetota bacterium]